MKIINRDLFLLTFFVTVFSAIKLTAQMPAIEQIKSELAEQYAVKPMQLQNKFRGQIAQRMERIMLQQSRYLITTLHPWEQDSRALLLTKGGSGEHDIRPNAHTVYSLAVGYRYVKDGYLPQFR